MLGINFYDYQVCYFSSQNFCKLWLPDVQKCFAKILQTRNLAASEVSWTEEGFKISTRFSRSYFMVSMFESLLVLIKIDYTKILKYIHIRQAQLQSYVSSIIMKNHKFFLCLYGLLHINCEKVNFFLTSLYSFWKIMIIASYGSSQ